MRPVAQTSFAARPRMDQSQGVPDGDHMFAVGALELVLLAVVGHFGKELRRLHGEARLRGLWFRGARFREFKF